MNFKPQGVTVRKRKYGLFVIDRVVQRQYLFRYGMQGYERFHLCLLAVDTDIPIESIAKMMGHSNIRTTQGYARITDDKISKDMDKLMERRKKQSTGEKTNKSN